MDQLLTVIVQTSPIPSHPSTALLEALFRSFRQVDGLRECRFIIVCDGCDEVDTVSGQVEGLKHGRASFDTASRYREHLQKLRNRLDIAPFGGCSIQGRGSVELLELAERHGSARAIEVAFRTKVETPFVMIAQHDNLFVSSVPLRSIVAAMKYNSWVKALHFHATATLNYSEKAQKRYGLELESRKMDGTEFLLVPLMFWYGRTHIARSDYYDNFVLNRFLRKGDHLEEVLGETQLREVLKNGLGAHEKYGNFIFNQGNKEVLYHLSGRRAIAVKGPYDGSDVCVHGDEQIETDSKSRFNAKVKDGTSLTTFHPSGSSFTTARSCRAVVPGLVLPPASGLAQLPSGRFKQKCFHCGIKGHSFRFCPDRQTPPEVESIEI